MARPLQLLHLGMRQEMPLLPDFHLTEVEGIEAQLDLPAGQEGIDTVAVALQRDRRRAGDGALLSPEERLP